MSPLLVVVLLLLITSTTFPSLHLPSDALSLRGIPVKFGTRNFTVADGGEGRRLERDEDALTLVYGRRGRVDPDDVVEFVDKNTFLTKSSKVLRDDLVAEYSWRYKYDPDIRVSAPGYEFVVSVVVASETDDLSNVLDYTFEKIKTFGRRWRISKKKLDASRDVVSDILETLASRSDVAVVDDVPTVRVSWTESRRVHFGDVDGTGFSTSTDGGEGVIVAIADTGFDVHHACFYVPGEPVYVGSVVPGSHPKIASLVTAVPGITDYVDTFAGHGSAVASVAGCQELVSPAYPGVVWRTGVAPRVRFALYDFSADGSTIVLPASFETWLDDVCSKGGATVVNMSFGSVYADGKYDGFAAMVDSIVRRRPKCSVNIACGNDGPDGLCSSPSTCKNGISWGAAMARPEAYPQFDVSKNPELYDATYAIKFSSRGPLKDGRRAPLLHSTGVEVLAALGYSVPVAGHADFFKLSGTSFASPAGAGVVAVVQSDYASKNGGEIPSASLVIARLIASAEQMRGTVTLSNGAAVVLDGAKTNTGYGVPRSPVGAGIDYESSIADGQRRTFCFVANEASKRISVGAAWTVPAGLPGTDFLVNDLDFRFLRNGATVGFSKNSVDPNEKFVVEDVVAGEYFKLVAFEKDSKTAGGLPQTFSVSVLGEGLTRSPLCEKDDGCLPDDKSACTNGIRVCDAYSGKFSDECMTTKCSVNGGPNCTTTTSELSCSVPFGKGKISAGDGKCVPTSCDENYVVSESSCVCAPDLEIVCPSAPAFKKCGKDGKYSSCPSLVSSPTPPQSQTTSTAAAGVDASFSTSLAVAAFSLFVSL